MKPARVSKTVEEKCYKKSERLEKHRELFMIENGAKYLRLIDIGTGAFLVVFHKSFSSLSPE